MNRNGTSLMHKNFIAKLAIAALALSVTAGCLSDEEKEARRAWAYDLSGDYTEVRDEGVSAGTVVIENEQSKNDIKITFTRGDLYEGEQAYLDLVAEEAEWTALLETLVLGAGESNVTEELIGGENISDNFGESSKLAVSSEEYGATPKIEEATEATVHYSISAEILNNSDELRGTLTIHYKDRRPSTEPDAEEGERVLHTENEAFNVVLKRVAGPIEGDVCDDCKSGPSDDEEGAEDGADEEGDPADESGEE